MPFCQIKKPATASENDFYTDQKIDIFIPICKKLAKLLICYVIGVLPNAMHKSLILASETSFVLGTTRYAWFSTRFARKSSNNWIVLVPTTLRDNHRTFPANPTFLSLNGKRRRR